VRRKQTRKSISISGELYTALKAWCTAAEVSQSGLAERLLREHLGMEQRTMGRPRPAEDSNKKPEVVTTRVTTRVNPKAKPAGRPGSKMPVIRKPRKPEIDLDARRKLIEDKARGGGIFTF